MDKSFVEMVQEKGSFVLPLEFKPWMSRKPKDIPFGKIPKIHNIYQKYSKILESGLATGQIKWEEKLKRKRTIKSSTRKLIVIEKVDAKVYKVLYDASEFISKQFSIEYSNWAAKHWSNGEELQSCFNKVPEKVDSKDKEVEDIFVRGVNSIKHIL